ncbi:hypothetical protein [Flaviaesturariibacter terrae]
MERVNEAGAFDVELNPKPKDRLEVTFTLNKGDYESYLSYGFEFKKGKWIECDYDSLEWMWRHDEKIGGNMKDAFEE